MGRLRRVHLSKTGCSCARSPTYKAPVLRLACWLYATMAEAENAKCFYLPGAKVPWPGYTFADGVSWSRTLVERLDRRPENRKLGRQGLIPALRPQSLKDDCQELLDRFRSGPIGGSRVLANFMLHTALVAHPFSGTKIDTDGRISLPVPDIGLQPTAADGILIRRVVRNRRPTI